MKKMMRVVICTVLALMFIMAPMEAMAKTVNIYRVNADLVRVHSTPKNGLSNVTAKLRAGTKVFYLGRGKGSAACWWKVRSDHGVTGYVYKDFLSYYGATTLNRVYKATKAAYVYKGMSTGSGKVTSISRNEHVIVYSAKGNWVAIATLSGKQGYVKKSVLKKAS